MNGIAKQRSQQAGLSGLLCLVGVGVMGCPNPTGGTAPPMLSVENRTSGRATITFNADGAAKTVEVAAGQEMQDGFDTCPQSIVLLEVARTLEGQPSAVTTFDGAENNLSIGADYSCGSDIVIVITDAAVQLRVE